MRRRGGLLHLGVLLLSTPPRTAAKTWVSEWGEQPRWRQLKDEAIEIAKAGRPADSLPLFKQALAEHMSAENLNNVAVAFEQTRDYKRAHRYYLRALNHDANNNVYKTLQNLRGRLLVDVPKFVSEQRRARANAPQPNGTCDTRERVQAPPPKPLPHLVDRSQPPPRWSEPVVLVVAHWKEDLTWLNSNGLEYVPRVLYQRHDANAPYYSPNHGNEAGVYLQFIVEHYDALPEQVVFLQGDPANHVDMGTLLETIRCLRAGEVPYLSLSSMPHLPDRNLDNYTGVWSPAHVAPFHHLVPKCARDFLALFAIEPPADLVVGTYCCATFTASREAIRRHPLSAWRRLYEVVGTNVDRCVWNERVAAAGGNVAGLADLNEGFIMEHLWHALLGEPFRSAPNRGDEGCRVARCGRYCPDPSRPELGAFGAFT